jgi:hypothetical protein
MTTATEEKIRELAVRGTGATVVTTTTVLGLVLLFAQYSVVPFDVQEKRFYLPGTQGTISRPQSLEISEVDLFNQVNRIYDELLKNQIELDTDSKRALYGNLWNLYT